jgi:uncharacterized protein
MDEFEVPFSGLKEGIYKYEYRIGPEFFKYFDNEDIPGGELNLDLTLTKGKQVMEFDFNISGNLNLICDRCLVIFDSFTEINEVLYIRFGDKYEELDDNIVIIPREESRINIAQFVYEFIALSIPYKKIHPELPDGKSGCDPEMIRKLNELKVKENFKNEIDPRWDKLKNLN